MTLFDKIAKTIGFVAGVGMAAFVVATPSPYAEMTVATASGLGLYLADPGWYNILSYSYMGYVTTALAVIAHNRYQ